MYDELIKVLRFCETHATCRECLYCPKDAEDMRCNILLNEAADAIEELSKRCKVLEREVDPLYGWEPPKEET